MALGATGLSAEGTWYKDLGLRVPRLSLPREGADPQKWAVIACDQYTSEPAYWERVAKLVGDDPSMLHLTFPEVYLPQKRDPEIIEGILKKMREYRASGVLAEQDPGFVLVDRKTPAAESRLGLVVALDLELYSFAKGTQSLIRPTELTIEARLPPRVAVRKDAIYESPHIMVLIDDPGCTVIEPLAKRRTELKKLYDFDLMEESGHLAGYHVTSQADTDMVAEALRKLGSREHFRAKYGASEDKEPILFAVGDGNHSLATAKRCWEALREGGAPDDHPARFALVELVNMHDPGLVFHPIHRLVEGVDSSAAFDSFQRFFEAQGCKVNFEPCAAGGSAGRDADAKTDPAHRIEFISKDKRGVFVISQPKMMLEAASLDSWLNGFVEGTKGAELDFVHEEYTIDAKCREESTTLGFLLPVINKDNLLATVVKEGVLPRKAFSMGLAPEKRFYHECRAILP